MGERERGPTVTRHSRIQETKRKQEREEGEGEKRKEKKRKREKKKKKRREREKRFKRRGEEKNVERKEKGKRGERKEARGNARGSRRTDRALGTWDGGRWTRQMGRDGSGDKPCSRAVFGQVKYRVQSRQADTQERS